MQANNYWSSTTYAKNTTNAWNVNMNNGNVNNNNKTNNNYVWPVRSGEWLPLFSFENLYKQYRICRRNKRNTINALLFEINAEENLLKLAGELSARSYKPSRSVCFIVQRPKMREIIAADFRDRVVHHVLVDRLEALYGPIFIHDTYACRKHKGLHKAVQQVRRFVRTAAGNERKKLFFCHLDIKNFFMNIDKDVLFGLVKKKVHDEDLLWLAKTIIFHNPTESCIIKGKPQQGSNLPSHKSLFHAEENRGLPIGNLTSQFFANLYLNELDQYVKHTLKHRSYVRYCDDFLLLDESPDRLEEFKQNIGEFLKAKLRLSLNEKHGKVLPVSNGMDFLGYIIRQDYTLVRRRVVNNLKTKLADFERRLVQKTKNRTMLRYDYELLEELRAVLASYWGHLQWADTWGLREAILKRHDFLENYFAVAKTGEKKLVPLFRHPKTFSSVKGQYRYYARRFNNAAVFFQVGSFYEFYPNSNKTIKEKTTNVWNFSANGICELQRLRNRNRATCHGFPLRLEHAYTEKFLANGSNVVIVKETDRYFGRIKERLPVTAIIKTKEELPC